MLKVNSVNAVNKDKEMENLQTRRHEENRHDVDALKKQMASVTTNLEKNVEPSLARLEKEIDCLRNDMTDGFEKQSLALAGMGDKINYWGRRVTAISAGAGGILIALKFLLR